MWVFYVLFLVPIAIQQFTIKGHFIDFEKKNRLALLFFFIFLTVLVGLRHELIGTDTINYVYYFESFGNESWSDLIEGFSEFGFFYFNKIIYTFTNNVQVYFIVTAVVTFAMIYLIYRKSCIDPSLTIVLYCVMSTFVMAFSGIRQMLAVGIGVVAYEFTRKKKLIPFILCVVLAMTFHVSAFMIAFMYPLYYARITKKWLLVVVPLMAVTFVFNKQIFSSTVLILAQFTKYDGSIAQTGAYTMLILFVVFAVFSFIIPDDSLLDSETIGLRNLLLLSVVLQMFAPLHTIAMRMNYYYIIFIPLLIPKIIRARSKKWEDVAVFARHIMVAFFAVYFFYNAYMGSNSLDVFPYHFFWEVV